ncbi:MAG: T9SS type A sorting domain-containing protein [Fibrobacteria bacterium]
MIIFASPSPISPKPRAKATLAILAALALCAASPSRALVGDWSSLTHLQVIRDLEGLKGNLFAATTGGIIKVAPSGAQKVYRNTEGLRDVGIAALVPGRDGELYAASELGYIYAYDRGADDWDVLSTAYRGAGWTMNKRALVYREGYLVAGSSKGLSFFNIGKRVADANVSKMAGASGLSVNSLLFVGDTLFAGTNRGIFRAVLHLGKLLTDPKINVFNPGIWSMVPGSEGAYFYHPEPTDGDTAILSDSLRQVEEIRTSAPSEVDPGTFSHGVLYHGPDGIGSEYEGASIPEENVRISTFGFTIAMEGKIVRSPSRLEAISHIGDRWYVGDEFGLFRYYPDLDGYLPINNPENIPLEGVTAIKAERSGIFALATPHVYQLHGRTWDTIPGVFVESDAAESKIRGQHAFDVPASGEFHVGTWGHGFQTFRNGKSTGFDAMNSCLPTAIDIAPNYSVVWSQAPYKDKGIWLGNLVSGKPYRLAYYDFASAKISCMEVDNREGEPRTLQVVDDMVLAVISNRGVEAFRIKDEGGAVSLLPENLLARLGSAGIAPLAGKMDRRGNFWVTTETSLLYIPAIAFHRDSVRTYRSLDGFSGTGCKNLEIDPQGHLWAGCGEGGVFEIIPGRDTLSHAFRHYGLNDGLLSETIFNLEVNPLNGEVWISTEKGLSRYESRSRPDLPDLSSAKVFPNPFLAKHENLVFANLSPGSAIQVMTQSGSVVYQRTLAAGEGDQIRWNGRNMAGVRVKEGVYFYVVRSPKEMKNGKIIVAR